MIITGSGPSRPEYYIPSLGGTDDCGRVAHRSWILNSTNLMSSLGHGRQGEESKQKVVVVLL